MLRPLLLHCMPARIAATLCKVVAAPVQASHKSALDTRLHGTRPNTADRYLSPMESAISKRAQLLHQFPQELLKVVGVSFDNRQDAVSRLEKGQGLAFVREPENPYDPQAVGVTTLNGVSIGHVPRDRTGPFVHSITFGRVASVGQSAKSLWGCTAEVQPKAPPMTVIPVPDNLTGHIDVAEALEGTPGWNNVKKEIVERFQGRCAISGEHTVSVSERWEVDNENAVMKLIGFVLQCRQVTRVQRMLESGENLESVLQAMNRWRAEDVATYLDGVCKAQGRMKGTNWKLDLGILRKDMNLVIPDQFAKFLV